MKNKCLWLIDWKLNVYKFQSKVRFYLSENILRRYLKVQGLTVYQVYV